MKLRDESGFTLVELIITMVVMTILMALGTVSFAGLQGQARDKERESDIESLARGLELRYSRGNQTYVAINAHYKSWLDAGQYPGTAEMDYGFGYPKGEFDPQTPPGDSFSYMARAFQIPRAALFPPTEPYTIDVLCRAPNGENDASCGAAENQTKINTRLSKDKYMYEPVTASGQICYGGGCTRFNLYWRDEGGTIHKVRSKHQ